MRKTSEFGKFHDDAEEETVDYADNLTDCINGGRLGQHIGIEIDPELGRDPGKVDLIKTKEKKCMRRL